MIYNIHIPPSYFERREAAEAELHAAEGPVPVDTVDLAWSGFYRAFREFMEENERRLSALINGNGAAP